MRGAIQVRRTSCLFQFFTYIIKAPKRTFKTVLDSIPINIKSLKRCPPILWKGVLLRILYSWKGVLPKKIKDLAIIRKLQMLPRRNLNCRWNIWLSLNLHYLFYVSRREWCRKSPCSVKRVYSAKVSSEWKGVLPWEDTFWNRHGGLVEGGYYIRVHKSRVI